MGQPNPDDHARPDVRALVSHPNARRPGPDSILPPSDKGHLAPALPYRRKGESKYRFIRAYYTTFVVIFSYLWISFGSKVFGEGWREQRLDKAHKRNAKRVYKTILKLQGLFIKVGQLLSIMANFLPEAFRHELEGLQDQVPPRSFDEIAPRVEFELGAPVDTIFRDFRRVPIASASLGQVHEARLPDGRRVCVKVQHLDVDEIVRIDLKTIRRILQIIRLFVPLQGLDAYYSQIKELLKQELDFRTEADSIERIAANFTKDTRVVFPTPIRELSTSRVLTTLFLEGKKVSDTQGIDAMGVDKREIAKKLVSTYCQMIFIDGVYHADPHPGNILVRSDGALILLDFGATAELSPQMKDGIPEFLEAALRRDTEMLVAAMRKMGFISRAADEEMTERIIEYFHERFHDEIKIESFNLKDVKVDPQRGFENLLNLQKMDIGLKELSGAFHIPKDWVLLERTLLLLYGCCALLDPNLNPVSIIQPYLRDFVLGSRDWTQVAMQSVRDAAMGALTLPSDMRKLFTKTMRGQIELRVRGLPDLARTTYVVGRQVIYASFSIFFAYVSLQLYLHGKMLACYAFAAASLAWFAILAASSILSRPKGGRWT